MKASEAVENKSQQQTRGPKIILAVLFVIFIICVVYSIRSHHHRNPWAWMVKQSAQLSSIDTAIELWKSEIKAYPPSDALDEAGVAYCGAMKLCEAVMGQDLLGFHKDSIFRSDGTDGAGKLLYPPVPKDAYVDPMAPRKGPYLPIENAHAHSLADLYGEENTGPFDPNHKVICGVFRQIQLRGTDKKIGMPILYYKADTSKSSHDLNDPNNPDNIFNYKDNHALLALGVPGKPGEKHPMYEDPKIFYDMTRNENIKNESKPYRGDTYILISTGLDGLYGTVDDIVNFDR